jgi:hypothetical protein
VDVNPLEQWNAQVASAPVTLFKPAPAFQWGERAFDGQSNGQKWFSAPSPQLGAEITYRLAQRAQGPARVVVQDVSGDTLATLNGSANSGLNRVTWNYRGKAPPSPRLSPAGVRDSIRNIQMAMRALDSLEKENAVPKMILDRVRTAMTQGPAAMQDLVTQFAGAFGGGAAATFGMPGVGGPPPFNERPGETRPVAPSGAGRAFGPGGAPGAAAMGEGAAAVVMPDQNQLMNLFRALGGMAGRGGFFAAGAMAPPLVGTGDYLVTLSVGGQAYRQVLRVERVSGSGIVGGLFQTP